MQHALALLVSQPGHEDSLVILSKLLANLANKPQDPKFRQVRPRVPCSAGASGAACPAPLCAGRATSPRQLAACRGRSFRQGRQAGAHRRCPQPLAARRRAAARRCG
jgi:hypothetical protein